MVVKLPDKTFETNFSRLIVPRSAQRAAATAQEADSCTRAVVQSSVQESRCCDREWYYSVVAHRRQCNDIRSSSTPDTFGKKVPSLSEVGIIIPASTVSRLATASTLHGLAWPNPHVVVCSRGHSQPQPDHCARA